MGISKPLILLCFCISTRCLQALAAFVVPWTNQRFGPDGPWQAVNIQVGGYTANRILGVQNVSTLSVYPGGAWQSMSFSALACENFSSATCGTGGFWEPDFRLYHSVNASINVVRWPASWVDRSFGIQVENAMTVVLGLTINKTTAWNATLASATSGNITYPADQSGQARPVTLGYLSLGADKVYQEFEVGRPSPPITAFTFPGQLFQSKIISSYSYGLHIGSAAFDYPGSLVFGGYNKGRLLEPIASFSNESALDLLDISIGVTSGNSPFNFTSKNNLLSADGDRITIFPDPLSPYIALPRQTCENLAGVLPVVFDDVLQYYLWNTSDPDFERIVTSPAYLGFSFPRSPTNDEPVVIKVPFALLNLTLDAPITSAPVQYFPCAPNNDTFVLGRAFLQAAFLGRNWEMRSSWIAQAPGPGLKEGMPGEEKRQGLGEETIDILNQTTVIEGYGGSDWFARSWEGQWSLEESLKGQGMNPSSNSTHLGEAGLSNGAKAAIGVGAAIGAIAVIAGLFLAWKKLAKRRVPSSNYQKGYSEQRHTHEAPSDSKPMAELSQGPRYLDAELPNPQQYVELPYNQQDPVEIGGTELRNA